MKKRKKNKSKEKSVLGILTLVLLVVLLLGEAYFILSFYNIDILKVITVKKCEDLDCFEAALKNCKKVEFRYAGENIWKYEIKGKQGNNCLVSAKLLQLKQGPFNAEKLEGKSMICEIPKGSVDLPGEDLSVCSGELKEEIQDVLIERLHSYIAENLGKISEDIKKVF